MKKFILQKNLDVQEGKKATASRSMRVRLSKFAKQDDRKQSSNLRAKTKASSQKAKTSHPRKLEKPNVLKGRNRKATTIQMMISI